MTEDARLRALSRLARSTTADAEAALSEELKEAAAALQATSGHMEISQALDVLGVVGFRFPVDVLSLLSKFLDSIEAGRPQDNGDADEPFSGERYIYYLARKAIDVSLRLRYLQTKEVLTLLLRTLSSPSEDLQKKVKSGLDALVEYDAAVFYGDEQSGIGTRPQEEVLEVLEGLDDDELAALLEPARDMVANILSPTISGARWRSDSVQLSFSAVPAIPSVVKIRERAIALLIRLYFLSKTVEQKRSLIVALTAASRHEDRAAKDAAIDEMIRRNTMVVLHFFEQQAGLEIALPLLQMLEARSYWIYRHSEDVAIKSAALAVGKAISQNAEYEIYRVLIGFEGVFGDWETGPTRRGDFQRIEESRKEQAIAFANQIDETNLGTWKSRILEYAKTESNDLATFPIFYQFLRNIATHCSPLALSLVSASSDAPQMDRFLIPLIAGLWNGPQQADARALIEQWIKEAKENEDHHLYPSIKMFLSTDTLDMELLRQLLKAAQEIKDIASLRLVASIAVARYDDDPPALRALFLEAVSAASELNDAGWIYDAWYQAGTKTLLESLEGVEIERVLSNLERLSALDFHAEEILFVIANEHPGRVVQFLLNRLRREAQVKNEPDGEGFDAIPYDFHKLHDALVSIPHDAVQRVLNYYREDEELFRFRGGALLKNLYPNFPKEFEAELIALVRDTGRNIDFVLGILFNYQGEPFLHKLIQEVLVAAGGSESVEAEVARVLQTTGVVSGELGLVEAYEQKRREVLGWLDDPRENVRKFAKSYISMLERLCDAERARAEESRLLRKHRYGEDAN